MKKKLSEFMSGWFGGPPLYHQRTDRPCIVSAHAAFAIDAGARDRWLACMRRALADCATLDTELARGEYGTLLKWLREKVHRHGMRHHPQELMRLATGEGTNTEAHLAALRKKYDVR